MFWVQKAVERAVVENASKSAPWKQDGDLGQRYADYHRQFGNLQGTGYTLAADEAHGFIRRFAQAVRHVFARPVSKTSVAEQRTGQQARPAQRGATGLRASGK